MMNNILVQFNVAGFTPEQYSKAVKDLEEAGAGHPKGRLYHIAVLRGNGILVLDVWSSEQELDQFTKILVPILQKNGVTPAVPEIMAIHNIISF